MIKSLGNAAIPEKHEVDPFVTLLKRKATFCAVGALDQMSGYNNQEPVMHRRTLAGSLIGSIKETQDVRFRHVVDMSCLKREMAAA